MFSGYQKGRVERKELIFILTIYFIEWRITDAYNYADNTTFCGCDLDLNSLIIRINNDQVFALKSNYTKLYPLHKKWSFPLTISSVNVTKSAVSCGFGQIY